jgi:hypothetical protein
LLYNPEELPRSITTEVSNLQSDTLLNTMEGKLQELNFNHNSTKFENCAVLLGRTVGMARKESVLEVPSKLVLDGSQQAKKAFRLCATIPQHKYAAGSNMNEFIFKGSSKEEIRPILKAVNARYQSERFAQFVLDYFLFKDTDVTLGVVSAWHRYPDLFDIRKVGDCLLFTLPHAQYSSLKTYEDPSKAKDEEMGVSLITWCIPPVYLFELGVFSDKQSSETWEDFVKRKLEEIETWTSENWKGFVKRKLEENVSSENVPLPTYDAEKVKTDKRPKGDKNPALSTFQGIRDRFPGMRTWAQPLDLIQEDLEILRVMAGVVRKMGEDIYKCDFTGDDTLVQYAHTFHLSDTIGLHFHHRINQRIEPGELARSILLTEIQSELENSEDLSGLIQKRQDAGKNIKRHCLPPHKADPMVEQWIKDDEGGAVMEMKVTKAPNDIEMALPGVCQSQCQRDEDKGDGTGEVADKGWRNSSNSWVLNSNFEF